MTRSDSSVVCRIGAGAGFAGDRIDPAVALANSGAVDAVVLECLAERTLVPAIKARAENPDAGFDPRLRRRLTPLLPAAHANGCQIVSNLGAANPAAAGRAISALARELGLSGKRVAAIEGDDVMSQREHVDWVRPVEGRLLGAHAYLGCVPLSDALEQGADVVVTGRVADSALFSAVARRHLLSTEQALAGAITVGHLLECGGQLTGGNYEPVGGAGAAGNRLTARDYARLGYPLADVYADGSADITILQDHPGIVDAMTCSLQLLYEVHDPARYATPDLIVDFSGVSFTQVGPNRVRMAGARSLGPPPTLKVAGFLELPGFIADCEIGFAGSHAFARAHMAAETLRLRLADWPAHDVAVDVVGTDSILRAGSVQAPPGAELRVHVSARCRDLEQAQIVEDEVYALTLSGPAGGCSVRSERRPRIEVLDGFIAHERIAPRIVWSTS
jgi:hypothetical protein